MAGLLLIILIIRLHRPIDIGVTGHGAIYQCESAQVCQRSGSRKNAENNLLLSVQSYIVTIAAFLIITSNVYASGTYPVDNPSTPLIGLSGFYTIQDKDSLIELARTYSVGYNEITDANIHVDPWVPDAGTRIIIPTTWLLPESIRDEVVINLAELRLYFFYSVDGRKYVSTYPLGIGSQGFSTPTGTFKITAKIKDPVWRIPTGFRDEYPDLPDFVRPGPDNPLGKYWLQLSVNGYGIHGTNRPYGIGRRVSHGCIRLYPEDIETLYKFIKPGTRVRIVNEPVKVGWHNNKVYIEVHRSEMEHSDLMKAAIQKLSRKHLLEYVDTPLMVNEVKNATGLPADISR